jgi:SAM-dependent methyltransferase
MRLRETFDEAAELYDRARPGYPAALFSDLAELVCMGPGCRFLEIGCGTGQATLPLAERCCEIVCVELGASLAAVARRKLARFRSVRVDVAAFEPWPLPPEPFDTVVAAKALSLDRRRRARHEVCAGAAPGRRACHDSHTPHRGRRRAILRRGPGLLRAVGPRHPARASSARRGRDPVRQPGA